MAQIKSQILNNFSAFLEKNSSSMTETSVTGFIIGPIGGLVENPSIT